MLNSLQKRVRDCSSIRFDCMTKWNWLQLKMRQAQEFAAKGMLKEKAAALSAGSQFDQMIKKKSQVNWTIGDMDYEAYMRLLDSAVWTFRLASLFAIWLWIIGILTQSDLIDCRATAQVTNINWPTSNYPSSNSGLTGTGTVAMETKLLLWKQQWIWILIIHYTFNNNIMGF